MKTKSNYKIHKTRVWRTDIQGNKIWVPAARPRPAWWLQDEGMRRELLEGPFFDTRGIRNEHPTAS